MIGTQARRNAWRVWAAVVAGVALAVAPGCGGSGAARTSADPAEMDPSVRVAEAHRLAALAQDSAEESAQQLARGKTEQGVRARQEAIEYYGRAVALHDAMGAAWNNLGVLLLEEQRYMDASRALQKAATLNSTDPRPLDNLGLIYHRTGYEEEALRHYGEALKRDPNYLNSLRGGVLAASRLGRVDEEILSWAERGSLLETDPKWREIFMRERFQMATRLADVSKPVRTP